MPGPDSLSPWATLVLMLPFGVLLAMSMFGVDERLAAPKAKRLRARFCEVGADGRAELTDPDGSGWRPRRLERGVGAQGSNRLDAGSYEDCGSAAREPQLNYRYKLDLLLCKFGVEPRLPK